MSEAGLVIVSSTIQASKKPGAYFLSRSSPAVSPLMRDVSTYIAGALKKPLPAAAAECGKQHLVDTLAAIVSGSRLLPGQMGIAYAKSLGGVKESTIIGTRVV